MKTSDLEKIVYFQDYVVIDPGDTRAEVQAAADRRRVPRRLREVRRAAFDAQMGAEAITKLLEQLDLDTERREAPRGHREDQQQAEDQGPHQAAEDRSKQIRGSENKIRRGWSWT